MLNLNPKLKHVLPRLRRQHKDLHLLELEDTSSSISQVLIRPLTRKEYMHVETDVELGCDSTDIIMETCIVWPEARWDNIVANPFYDLPCQCFNQICEAIIDISRFASAEAIAHTFMEARQAINSLNGVMTGVICHTFGSITPQMLDDMPLWDLARLFAMAEQTLPEPIDLRLFLDPDYAAKVQAKLEAKAAKKGFRVPGIPGNFGAGNHNTMNETVDLRAPLPPGYDSSMLPPEVTATDIARLHPTHAQDTAMRRRAQEGTMGEGTL